MERLIQDLLLAILAGGPSAIIALLLGFIGYLIWDRLKLIQSMKDNGAQYRTSLENVLEKYHQGQIGLIEAFNEIKLILAKLEGKL